MPSLLTLLFKRNPQRCFARLDALGHCQAFKQCAQPPASSGWVEIYEIRLAWLNQPLPSSARVSKRVSGNWLQRSLAA
ncbi:hypothetical protein EXN22_05470 [Pseudomonas tructae]|uniref:Uncharacterized protein n=1 Tax=Pseudomonas tructae TaxID=2518644 RepID=A0A411ME87_9PSED|nr:hypothetical protein [Pseudomonas tructae]QBF25163.1 hypothetical protein EXN22_05470 [Pseudomonas tructae]